MNRVLIIDDDRFTQNVIRRSLCNDYETRTADNGAMGLKVAGNWSPDIILLDVEMPGQNGYEVCDALKGNEQTAHIPVVFLSGHKSVRELMLGFEAGADDYLTKPFDPEVLNTKLSKITEHYSHKKSLASSAQLAEKTAMEAMTSNFELGRAVRFVELSHNIANYAQLASALIEATSSLGLSCSVMFKSSEGDHFFSAQGAGVSPLEENLLKVTHGTERFVDFGCRTVISFPQLALLVKNMPLDDRARYGRIKDTLPFMLGACDAKVRVLDAEQALRTQTEHLARSAHSIQSLLTEISKKVADNQQSVRSIMLALTSELSLELHKLGLEKDQEDYVLEQVDQATNQLHDAAKSVESVEYALNTMVKVLQLLSTEQTRIVTEKLGATEQVAPTISQDIELF